jgi:adenylylsulfate kinase
LDEDELRRTTSGEQGFSKEERETHTRRIPYLSHLIFRNGVVLIVALIAPYRSLRQYARNLVCSFIEVWMELQERSLRISMKRDPKGLNRNASQGNMKNMTGLQAPYEPPLNSEVIVNTANATSEQCAAKIIE